MSVYIIDRLEHGNGGVYGTNILASLPLREALKTCPAQFGVTSKEFGFWPVICRSKDPNKNSYVWNDGDHCWERVQHKKVAQRSGKRPRKNKRYISKTKYLKELLRHHVTYDKVADSLKHQGSRIPKNLGVIMSAMRRIFWGLYEESKRV